MHPSILDLASSRAGSDEDRQRLQAVAAIAREHKCVADAFEADITASKAARGEAPAQSGRGPRSSRSSTATPNKATAN